MCEMNIPQNKQIITRCPNVNVLADDITLILLYLYSVKSSFTILKMFSNCVGLNINVDKTKAKYIGYFMSCDHFQHGLSSQIEHPIDTLGITITDYRSTYSISSTKIVWLLFYL